MTAIILHQYDSSPFSEKVRICLGIKQLAWSAVDQPVIMPKPDLVPLTGGYRRIPVMQIGADIYCDSALIVRELERRYSGPSLYPNGSSGLASAVEIWCDKGLFQPAVTAIFGTMGDKVDPAFIADREGLSGQPFKVAGMKAHVPFALSQVKAHAALLVEQLADGRAFLEGAKPGLADAAAFYNFWFVRSFCPGLADSFPDLPLFDGWYERVKAIGHGQRSNLSPVEALAIARDSEPVAGAIWETDAALAGKPVIVAAADYGTDPIAGILTASTRTSLTVTRTIERLGKVAVHVPRVGYSLQCP